MLQLLQIAAANDSDDPLGSHEGDVPANAQQLQGSTSLSTPLVACTNHTVLCMSAVCDAGQLKPLSVLTAVLPAAAAARASSGSSAAAAGPM
jgi:hypothetical protein